MAGFIRGILWGGTVAVGGLVVLSQLSPLDRGGPAVSPEIQPETQVAEAPVNAAPAPAAQPAPTEPTGSAPKTGTMPTEAVSPPEKAPEKLAEPAPTPTAPKPPEATASEPVVNTAPEAPAGSPPASPAAPAENEVVVPPAVDANAPETAAPKDADPAPAAPAPVVAPAPAAPNPAPVAEPVGADDAAAAPAAPQEAPAAPPSDAPGDQLASVAPDGSAPGTPSTAAEAAPKAKAPASVGNPEGEAAPEAAELPPPPPLTTEEEALLKPVQEEAPTQPVTPAEPPPSRLVPAPGLSDRADGVITGRLPRIGEASGAAEGTDNESGAAAELPSAGADYDPAQDDSLPPLQRYARPFENSAEKPLFAILLEDNGEEIDRAGLSALDLPLTIVIDPLSEGAAERAAQWRAGGQEVVMSTASLPSGATPADLEQIFQALSGRMPEAVAVIDATGATFQNDRLVAAQIVPILADQGRGLVTFDKGLNAADQVAQREGLPSARIFRRFDSGDASGAAVKRYLDRAVFKAAQEGQVAVLGSLRPETVAGLMEWSVEGRAATVAVAPLTALLSR